MYGHPSMSRAFQLAKQKQKISFSLGFLSVVVVLPHKHNSLFNKSILQGTGGLQIWVQSVFKSPLHQSLVPPL